MPTQMQFTELKSWGGIHQALLSQFSLLVDFLIGKVLVKGLDRRVLSLVNLTPAYKAY